MKIVGTDNYDRESVSDILVVENIDETAGKTVVEYLNKMLNSDGLESTYYVLRSDDYRLKRGMEDLV